MSKCKQEQIKQSSIGGQAVLEGVMMRGKNAMATAVRDADGVIRIESKRIKNPKRNLFLRLPLVRGVVAFISSLFMGTKVLMRSAEVYGEEEPTNFEKWLSKKFKVDIFAVVSFISLFIGLGLAILLFMVAPQALRVGIERIIGKEFKFGIWGINLIEGGAKVLIFILYILLTSLLKDIRRTFMYHGAEHKTISCYEKGLELTVENARTCTRVHNRCGTTFMFFVIAVSIIVFACFEALVIGSAIDGIYRVLCKIALLPLVAGISYEMLKGLAKTDCWVFYPLKLPGLLLQRITTREPDDQMIEVAINAFEMVVKMDEDLTVPEQQFVVAEKTNLLLKRVSEQLKSNGIDEYAEAEWIVSLVLSVKRNELDTDKLVKPLLVEKINKIVEERCTGRPLWYCIGDTEFYGYTIKVDERVLIPRPETELLVEQALKVVDHNSKVLDLCTGSGAIAISINKQANANVTATDISEKALDLAKENAQLNQASIEFVKSNMFEDIKGQFDLIVSNPPYIKRQVIASLQKEVKDFEPMLALDGGEDGLDFYRIIAKNLKDYLKKDGVLLLEIGFDQAEQVCSLLDFCTSVEVIKDYENNDRIIKAVL